MKTKHITMPGLLVMTATLLGTGLAGRPAQAALPKPTPAQQQAAADKKAKADAQAAKDKESLAASMDTVASHWRSRAAQQGWKSHPPVAVVAAAPAAGGAPAAGAPAPGVPAAAAVASGAAPAAAAIPIKSEKLGTAPPSADVKKAPTQPQPRNAKPTVDKGTPDVNNR